jgi:acyl carrier protein
MSDDKKQLIMSTIADILQRMFRYSAALVDAQTTAEDVNGWDSLSHMTLIMEVERVFAVRFDPYRIMDFRCIGDLADEVRRLTS